MANNILYISADPSHISMLKGELGIQYTIFAASSQEEAIAVLKTTEIHVLITDSAVKDGAGIELLSQLMKEYPEPIRILFTTIHQISNILDAINNDVIYKFLALPYTRSEVLTTIASAYDVYHLKKENRKLTDALLNANEKLNELTTKK